MNDEVRELRERLIEDFSDLRKTIREGDSKNKDMFYEASKEIRNVKSYVRDIFGSLVIAIILIFEALFFYLFCIEISYRSDKNYYNLNLKYKVDSLSREFDRKLYNLDRKVERSVDGLK